MNSRSPKRLAATSADPDVKSFIKALAVLSDCAARVSALDRKKIVEGLAAFNHDSEQQLDRMLELMDDIHRSFMRIRRKLNSEL